jgi:hypothetical protein
VGSSSQLPGFEILCSTLKDILGLVCEVDATLHALFINCREGLHSRLALASDIIVDCVLFAV